MSDIASIVAGLSPAARQWIVTAGYADPNTIQSLRRKGIVEHGRLSALGGQVYRYLTDRDGEG